MRRVEAYKLRGQSGMKAREVIRERFGLTLLNSDTDPFEFADDLLSSLREAGYAVVPVEPTEKMIAATDPLTDYVRDETLSNWDAMIAAAQA